MHRPALQNRGRIATLLVGFSVIPRAAQNALVISRASGMSISLSSSSTMSSANATAATFQLDAMVPPVLP